MQCLRLLSRLFKKISAPSLLTWALVAPPTLGKAAADPARPSIPTDNYPIVNDSAQPTLDRGLLESSPPDRLRLDPPYPQQPGIVVERPGPWGDPEAAQNAPQPPKAAPKKPETAPRPTSSFPPRPPSISSDFQGYSFNFHFSGFSHSNT